MLELPGWQIHEDEGELACSKRPWKVLGPSHILCPVHPFHLAGPELYPFTINTNLVSKNGHSWDTPSQKQLPFCEKPESHKEAQPSSQPAVNCQPRRHQVQLSLQHQLPFDCKHKYLEIPNKNCSQLNSNME